MVDMRELRRAEARKSKVFAALGADHQELTRHHRIGRAIEQMRQVLADQTFLKLVHAHGIQSMPQLLMPDGHGDSGHTSLDRSLDFVIAWRFFAPFLYSPTTAALLDRRWPGLSLELRDIFISIVSDGPFPQELRGRHRRTV